MKPALPAAFREGARAREAILLALVAAAALASAQLFDAAVHPERIHRPDHHARFAADAATLPALDALRVRAPAEATAPLKGLGTLRGLTPDTLGLYRRSRYLRASTADVVEAIAQLDLGVAPAPPPAPDLSSYYRDARGPYLGDLVLDEGRTTRDVREKVPGAGLSGEPLLREEEDREGRSIVRALLLGLAAEAFWLAWRRGMADALARLLAALLVLFALGLFGAGADRWSVAALALVAGAPAGAPLLAAAPCLLFPFPVLQRMGLVLCLGGALRLLLKRPALPPRPGRPAMARAAAVAVVLGISCHLALAAAPARAPEFPGVEAEASVRLVPEEDLAAAARALREGGLPVIGDEPLVPVSPGPRRRRNLWRIFIKATTLAKGAEGEERARFDDVADAAAQMSLTTIPRDLRWRLRARDGRRALWVAAPADRDDLTSARLYRVRGEREVRAAGRIAAVLVALAGALATALLLGRVRPVLVRFGGAVLGAALLLVAAPEKADLFLPLVPIAAAAPALAPALAVAAGALFLPGLFWPAVALLAAVSLRSPRFPRSPSS
ncbi:MAG TPA: hypothetical protein VFY93_15065 [Planctomycetota bacterium]|nr:hypothetical protein [Planctomycetota bacterium]